MGHFLLICFEPTAHSVTKEGGSNLAFFSLLWLPELLRREQLELLRHEQLELLRREQLRLLELLRREQLRLLELPEQLRIDLLSIYCPL